MHLEKDIMQEILNTVFDFAGKAALAAAIFFVGLWLCKKAKNLMKRALGRTNMDVTLASFLSNIAFGLAIAFVGIAALSQLGINTTSLAAILAAAGLAVGLALQGSLANFAAGVMIILLRHFKAGDYVEVAGTAGTVKDVSIFDTTLTTPDNRVIIVPNGHILEDNIVNYSANETRRLDMVVGVSYSDDLSKVKKTLENILSKEERILKEPETVIAVSELADNSVNLILRPWCKASDYWTLKWDLTEEIKTRFDKEGISIPFPQREVHVISNDDQPEQATSKTVKKAAVSGA